MGITFDSLWDLQRRAVATRFRNWQKYVTTIVMSWLPKPEDASNRVACAETLYNFLVWLRKDDAGHSKTKHSVHHETSTIGSGIARDDDEKARL